MKLPNGGKAVVEIAKLRDYCLNASHPEGRHKARVFPAALGLGPADEVMLQERLLAAARNQDAMAGDADEFGRRYVVDFSLEHTGRKALVRTAWIVLTTENFPRLTSCYVLRRL